MHMYTEILDNRFRSFSLINDVFKDMWGGGATMDRFTNYKSISISIGC